MSKILITGGTGTLGQAIAVAIPKDDEVVIFSRDEFAQVEMKKKFPEFKYIVGDVRDYGSVYDAMVGVDRVIHTAAMKYIDIAEEFPSECIKSNVIGTMNVIRAAKEHKVEMVVGISSDKALSPTSVYGSSKMLMERLFEEAGDNFLIVRFANIVGSRGSVIPHWIELASKGEPLVVTDKRMRRMFIRLDEAVWTVFDAMVQKRKLTIHRTKSANMWRVAEIIANGKSAVVEGKLRPGEVLDHDLTSEKEGERYGSDNAIEMTDMEIIEMIETL